MFNRLSAIQKSTQIQPRVSGVIFEGTRGTRTPTYWNEGYRTPTFKTQKKLPTIIFSEGLGFHLDP